MYYGLCDRTCGERGMLGGRCQRASETQEPACINISDVNSCKSLIEYSQGQECNKENQGYTGNCALACQGAKDDGSWRDYGGLFTWTGCPGH